MRDPDPLIEQGYIILAHVLTDYFSTKMEMDAL